MNYVIQKDNVSDLPGLVEAFKKYDIDGIIFFWVGGNKENAFLGKEEMENIGKISKKLKEDLQKAGIEQTRSWFPEITEADLENNEYVTLRILSGEREDSLVHILEDDFKLEIETFTVLTYVIIGLAILIVILVVTPFFHITANLIHNKTKNKAKN